MSGIQCSSCKQWFKTVADLEAHGCPGPGVRGWGKRFFAPLAAAIGLTIALTASSCQSDASTVSDNLSQEADRFNVVRQIVVTNTWNGETLWKVVGNCSIDIQRTDVLVLICKEGQGEFKKHYLSVGGGNIAWASTQVDNLDVSTIHTTVIFKPTAIVPNIDITVAEQ